MNDNYHRLLKRQLKKYFPGKIPNDFLHFIEAVNNSYSHFDGSRNLIERAMEISSEELTESNKKLFAESQRQKILIDSLKRSVRALAPESISLEEDDLLQIAEILKTEIEKRKNAEEQIILSEEKYRGMIENMELALMEVDFEGNIVNVYEQFCKITEFKKEELIGRNANDMLLDPVDAKVMKRETKARTEGKFGVYEIPIITKSGKKKWMIISGAPVLNDSGEVVGSLGVHFDITHRKETEAALEKAKINAEAALKSKEMFLANISHEIRTPMNAILGMSRLLNETALDSNQEQFIKAIQASAEGLMVIINDVLDMSKMSSGKFSVENISFNFEQSIETLRKSLLFKAEEKGIYLQTNIDSDIYPFLIGDPTRLTQILTNLLSNAIKFTFHGGVDLNIFLVKRKDGSDTIEFSVKDSGVGISKKQISNIFESFTQEDDSITRKFGGTGLGLAISKQLVEIFGGKLKVVSTKGKGSEFSFVITCHHGKIVESRKSKTIGEYDLSQYKILLAEDNEINRFLAITILKKWGAKIDEAENGKIAVEKVKTNDYNVILMDMQMPKMDGLEATQVIRKKLKSQVPIIALTANAIAGEKDKCMEAGMDDFISKPFDPDVLFQKISALCANSKREIQFAGSSESSRFSIKKLKTMYKGNLAFVQKTMTIFLGQFETDVEDIAQSMKKKDYPKVQQLAHKIRPNIDLFEIEELRDPIRNIELKAEKKDGEVLIPLVENLVVVSEQITSEMRMLFQRNPKE